MVASVYSTSASVQLSTKNSAPVLKQCNIFEAVQLFYVTVHILSNNLSKKKVLINRLPNPKPSQASGDDNDARHLYFLASVTMWSLCGMHILEVPACPVNNTGQQSKSMELVLKIVIPVVTSSFLIFLLASDWIMKWKKKQKLKDVEKVLEIGTYQLISYHEIQRATNNFDGSNLIGEGSSGSVYQGTLSSGNVVAIKVLDLENEQMSNGSLENWLYGEDFHLNLLQRVTIMLDAAMTIEYLHHGNDTPIVHCDLRPANVLLDEDMVAHVGDFGISKILAVSKSMAHTETLGTLGYTVPGTMMDVIDDNLFPEEEQITSKSEICIASMVELALDCTMEMPESRITMKDVVKRLNKIKNVFLET
ncbi:receptor kinase-like protein Xa21 [Capsicum annuum]|uniref:receptor kinase-like protein Xa21 n=1 Tax=Capsicum annuum TaxID=4072 RepID=UPI001FB08D63|nr:receptor kinase-like protein Xa21 [Capsicum annuum]